MTSTARSETLRRTKRSTLRAKQPKTSKTCIGRQKTKGQPAKQRLTDLDASTFASTLGQAVWLMSMSQEHQQQPLIAVEEHAVLPIMLKQFRLYSKDNQPVAFLTFACVSDDVRARIAAGDKKLAPAEWRSGPYVVVIDCVSPFNPPEQFVERFQADAASAESASA